jgi:hypothetical protein
MGLNKLLVEFGVEKEIKRDYGYVEKYLTYRGESTPYKAIVKNGELLAIVSRRYRLIENERVIEICKKIAEKKDFDFDVTETLTRVHVFLGDGDRGVVVHNSVDGSYAFRIDAYVKLNETVKTVFKIRDVEQVYKRHLKSVDNVVSKLEEIIAEIIKKADEFKYFIHKLDSLYATNYKDELEQLRDLFPKKYIETALALLTSKTLTGENITLKQFYERVASAVWTADIDMKTKVDYFDTLNSVMFAIVGWSDAGG